MEPDKIRIGGLMRCCTQTLADFYPNGPESKAEEGDVLSCKWGSHSMIFRDGYWEWNHS